MESNKKKNYLIKGNKLTKRLPPIGTVNSEDYAQQHFKQLLRGCVDISKISDHQIREVRIFLTSPFSDFKVERNLFMRQVIPELQSTCKSYGLNLRISDMRWGVASSPINEHLVQKLCLKEIETCRQTSVGPFFVLLIGNRYGYRPIPSEMSSSEFDLFFKIITEHFPKEVHIFSKWFKMDENADPPIYKLLPIKTYIPHYTNYENEIKRREAGNEWWTVETNIRNLLNRACQIAYNNGNLTMERRNQLMRSITETELITAVTGQDLNINKQDASRCLVYERHLNGLMVDLQSRVATKYIDYTIRDDKLICENSSQIALSEFKNSIHKIGLRQFRKFIVPWASSGISEDLTSHKTYLGKLASTIIKDVKELIFEQKNNLEKYSNKFTSANNNLQSEIIHHWIFCCQRTSLFHGRNNQFETILKLIKQDYNHPIFVLGDSGCGKTAFMAKLATLLQEQIQFNSDSSNVNSDISPEYFKNNQAPVIILRFLGTSTSTGNVQQLLFSLCHHIQLAYKLQMEFEKMTSLSNLQWLFNNLLQTISRKFSDQIPLIIILDGIDELQYSLKNNFISTENDFSWIPTYVPRGIHIILSIVPNTFDFSLYRNIEVRFEHCKSHFIQINQFDSEEIKHILETFQKNHCRKLIYEQQELVISKLMENPLPLYVKLVMDKTLSWSSYLPAPEWIIENTTESIVEKIFSNLENQYGKILISYTLAYLTLGLNGLNSVEIEDLLSMQDEVLNEVYQNSDPPIKGVIRLPSLLWASIHFDLSKILIEKRSDGKLTYCWCHNKIYQCAFKRYVNNPLLLVKLHCDLSNYYALDGNYKKSCILNNQKRNLEIIDADRLISSFAISEKEPRKMKSLSFHLMESDQPYNLSILCVANLNFLISYAKCFSVQELILWLRLCNERFPDNQTIYIIKKCIIFLQSLLEKNISHLPLQLLGQLNHLDKVQVSLSELDSDTYLNQTMPLIESLCEQCKRSIFTNSIGLVPSIACFPSSLGSTRVYIENVCNVIQLMDNSSHLILIDNYENVWRIRLFQLDIRIITCSINVDTKPKTIQIPSLNKIHIFVQDQNHLYVYEIITEQIAGKHDLSVNNKITLNDSMAVDSQGRWIAVAGQNRIGILEHRMINFDKYLISKKSIFAIREVDKTLAMQFIQCQFRNLLLTAHTYNSKANKMFIIKLWDYEENIEIWSIDLQTLSTNYSDFINLYLFPSNKQEDVLEDANLSYNKILIVLPNGSCFFIDNILDSKSFRCISKSDSSKPERNIIRSLTVDGEIISIVRFIEKQTFIQYIDKNGNLFTNDIPEQINTNMISFATINYLTKTLIIGSSVGIIYYISEDEVITWTGHRGAIDFISDRQQYKYHSKIKKSIKIVTFSHMDQVVKIWTKHTAKSQRIDNLSKTIFEEMSLFAFSSYSNIYVIMNEKASVLYCGTIDYIGIDTRTIQLEHDFDSSEETESGYSIMEMDIVLHDQAVLLYYINGIKLYNLSNGRKWSSLQMVANQISTTDKKQYWHCVYHSENFLLLTFKKLTGYFVLDYYILPSLSNIVWSKRKNFIY